MRKEKIGRHVYEIYDSITDLPVRNLHNLHKAILVDTAMGSGIDSIVGHLTIVGDLMKHDTKKAQVELENIKQAVLMSASAISPKHKGFAALVKTVDGKEISLEDVIESFNDAPNGRLGEFLRKLKGKLILSLKRTLSLQPKKITQPDYSRNNYS